MRRFIVFVLFILLTVGSIDLIARGSSGSSFRSSGSSFKSSGSSFKSSPAKTTKTVQPQKATPQKASSASTIKKPSNQNKPKAVSANKMDRKQTKAVKQKDQTAAKKYGDKKTATVEDQKKMAASNSYKSPTPPSVRPAYVPQTVIIGGGAPLSVGYYPIGGVYGYGYMDPVTSMYVALAGNQMIADNAAMRTAGYGNWNADGTPVRYSNPMAIISWLIGTMFVLAIIGIIIKFVI